MTPLEQALIARVSASGPLTIADYMAECLLHPDHGYYTIRDPLGAAGDFTTAPEISQMFGELVGLSLAQCWLDQGAPAPFHLVELGPGRGTLMADILRATAKLPGFHAAARVHLIEASPTLRAKQKASISFPFDHRDTLADVPDGPLFLIANEFFDALPIRQFQRDGDRWRERVIGLEKGQLAIGLSDPMQPEQLDPRRSDTQDGDIVETSIASQTIAQDIGNRIAKYGGAALLIDYGDWRSLGDTIQAVRNHESVDILDGPGTADLTAHVVFEDLAASATPARATAMTQQGVFLERLGITQRAQQLAQNLTGDALDEHIAAHRRLTHPEEMGSLFKVLGLYPENQTPPAGLEE